MQDERMALSKGGRAPSLYGAGAEGSALRLLRHIPLVPIVELLADGSEHGLHDPVPAGELGRAVVAQDLLLLGVVVICDIHPPDAAVHVVKPLHFFIIGGAHHELHMDLGATTASSDELRQHRPERLGTPVGLAVRQDEEQNGALARHPRCHELQGLCERSCALRRRLESLHEPGIRGALDASDRLPIQKEDVHPGAVKARGDVDDA
mmetsp:Transcript_78933/g.219477  ORF Transcript_78933/g.219477 Transcript_78933/m.219477 type:complete len:207 (-) Transcript_78933:360-980(-)